MSSNYTGNPLSAQSPSSAPGLDVDPIVVLPSSGDPLTAASVAQAFKTLADYSAWSNEFASRLVAGPAFSIYEDFTGDQVARGTFLNNADATFLDDSAQGAYGALSLSKGTDATSLLCTQKLAIASTNDLWFSCRVRAPAIGGSGSLIMVGIVQNAVAEFSGGGSVNWLAMTYSAALNGNSNWNFWYGAGDIVGSIPTSVNTAIAPGTTTYQRIDIYRIGTSIAAFIDGVSVASVAPVAFSLVGASAFHVVNRNGSGTSTIFSDYMKLYLPTVR